MTRGEKKAHVARLRANAVWLAKSGRGREALMLERSADEFESLHKLTRRRTVLWEK